MVSSRPVSLGWRASTAAASAPLATLLLRWPGRYGRKYPGADLTAD
jgi:hypothetical protein